MECDAVTKVVSEWMARPLVSACFWRGSARPTATARAPPPGRWAPLRYYSPPLQIIGYLGNSLLQAHRHYWLNAEASGGVALLPVY